ncbi:DUF3179 domain-containing protein [Halorarius litoreus]|uniref:DUF3179 domain-containing protein n=1 Tax=Halorarius litoreus TaxID=2962676 RepID=UPI0020CFCC1D|nr:DUF3179 domain-containing protein [Halorarius litoreus]
MNRRRWLALVGTGAVGSLAGCTVGYRGTPGESPARPVPERELVRGAARDGIPAIVDPVFGTDWDDIEFDAQDPLSGTYRAKPRLTPESPVIGVVRGEEARAYPLAVLNWHEIVNDTFPAAGGDAPLLVTYCPLCGSAVTAVRRVDDVVTTFGVSGLLYRNDLVMYDARTESLWSQIEARAIRGPKTGTTLDLVPSSFTTWGDWTDEHPDSLVLRPPPESSTVTGRTSTRNYDVNPYLGYESVDQIGIGGTYDDDRLHPKTEVLGIEHDGVATAYPYDRVAAAGVVNDEVGGLPVVVTLAGDQETLDGTGQLVAYERTVRGRVHQFTRSQGRLVAAGTRWSALTGRGVDGPLADESLVPATDVSPLFFFAWLAFAPDTTVYGE